MVQVSPEQDPDSPLKIQHVSKSFGGLKALDDVSLNLHRGIITTLVGPNGAGKTTLFNLITGYVRPTNGDVWWEGHSILGQTPWQIARLGIARTFQDLRLFTEMTVYENVLCAMETSSWFWQPNGTYPATARREKVERILEATKLADEAGVRARDLPYAGRKLLSLARIMANGATVWLLDEPAAGLDPRSYNLLVGVLRQEVREGTTICIIEHNLQIVLDISDRVGFLDRGRLLAEGKPHDIFEDPHLTSIYFGTRFP